MNHDITLKQNTRYFFFVILSATIVFLGVFIFIKHWQKTHTAKDRVVIRIYPQSNAHIAKLQNMRFISNKQINNDFVEVEGRFRDVLDLNNAGIPAAIVIESEQHAAIDSIYPTYSEIAAELLVLASVNPEVMTIEGIGKSQFYKKPIFAIKLSANDAQKQEKPAVLFMGGQHAREAVGIQVCIQIIRNLLENKETLEVRNWLKKMAVWIVPCVNPDGYDYVICNHLKYPWWRKNLRDNNGDGIFEPEFDGVDLNRNYDFNWAEGGSPESDKWYFRGKSPLSESEVQAIAKLARRERFVLAIDYHSFGESVLYPWGMEIIPPDKDLIVDIAENLANRLSRYNSNKHYRTIPLNGKSGQSSNWFYANWRTISFIVEIGPEYFPTSDMLEQIVNNQLRSVRYLLNRALQSGISGHVVDQFTGKPIAAILQLDYDFSPVVKPTLSDSGSGYFWRLLLPGRYTITASADEYRELIMKPILVNSTQNQVVEIKLEKVAAE